MAQIINPMIFEVGGGSQIDTKDKYNADYAGTGFSHTFEKDYDTVYLCCTGGCRDGFDGAYNLTYTGEGTVETLLDSKSRVYWDASTRYKKYKITGVKSGESLSVSGGAHYADYYSIFML